MVRSSLGARGEQGEVARGAVTENPPDNKNPHAEQSRTGTIYKHEGTADPSPLPTDCTQERATSSRPIKGRWLKYTVFPLFFCLFEHRQHGAGYPKLLSFDTVQLPLDLQGFERCHNSDSKVTCEIRGLETASFFYT